MYEIRRNAGRWRSPELWAAVVAAVLTLAGPVRAGVIVGHAAGFDPFYDVYSANAPNGVNVSVAPTVNTSPSFIGAGYDLSGIGWKASDSTFGVTMISPQFFVGAVHVGYGGSVQFAERVRDGNGQLTGQTILHTYTIAGSRRLDTTAPGAMDSDVFIGRLTNPIPASDHIAFYPIPFNSQTSAYYGQPLVNFGVNDGYGAGNRFHLGTNNIDQNGIGIATFTPPPATGPSPTVVAEYDFDPNRTSEFHLIGGDSGSPSFIPVNGQLAILGAHYGVDGATNTSADSFLPSYIDQINNYMAPDNQQVTLLNISPVPEPGTFVLVGLVAVTISGGHWLRRRRPARDAA